MGTRPITFEGQTYTFPADASDQEVSAALGKHIAPPQQEGLATKIGRGAALGAFSGAGIPETQTPIRDLAKSFVTPSPSGVPILDMLDPTGGALKGAESVFRNLWSAGKEGIKGIEQDDPEQAAHGITSGLVQALMLKGVSKAPEIASGKSEIVGAASKVGEVAKTAPKEVLGVGPSSERMAADRIAHGQAVKEHISNVEDAVHEEAKAGARGIDSAVDEAHPDGFFDKSGVRMGVRNALGEISKIPEKWPASVGKLLAEEKTTRTTGPTVGGRAMDLSNPNDLRAYENYKKAGVFTPEEIQRIEGAEKSPNWTMEQVRQLRSEVGRDLGRYENKGAVGAALNNVYGYLSGEMRKAAATVGKESEFLENNADYTQWKNDFHRSPLKKVLNGQTSQGILSALSDERTQSIMDKYKDYGADPDALKQEAKRATISGTVSRFSRPSKWDMIVAAISPHAAAFRLLIPYLMRNPKLLDMIGGKGLATEEGLKSIKPAQVYMNKKAAAIAGRNK
jgi:hypothetical protein